MTTEHKDGGPAFPQNDLSSYNMGPDGIGNGIGMSLRDYFAGQALAGLITDPPIEKTGAESRTRVAIASYAVADAMLRARVQP